MVAPVVRADKQPADTKASEILLGELPSGKKLFLLRKPNKSVRFIGYEDNKKVPEFLSGGYSSVASALHQVDSFIAKVKAKEMNEDGTKVVKKAAPKAAAKTTTKRTSTTKSK